MKFKLVLFVALTSVGALFAAEAENPKVETVKPVKWEKSVAVGLTLTSGNSDTLLFTANALGVRKWNRNELNVGANISYGENNKVVNNESFGAFSQYDRLFGEKNYGYVRVEGLHDAIADVEMRLTIGPGVGYYFIKNEKQTLRGEAGPAFVYEQLGTGKENFATLRVGEKYTLNLGERARLWQTAEFLPEVSDFSNYLLNFEIGVEADLTKKMALRVVLQNRYDSEPTKGRESNDIKLVSGISYKF
ncbi:DUF481 domain-containing protein [bacterium]|nr:DUF481 domain-containing protein [bacterium]